MLNSFLLNEFCFYYMENYGLPEHIFDKIYEIKNEKGKVSKIITYFPLSVDMKNQIQQIFGNNFSGSFGSIFSDVISEEEWIKSKSQIKRRFQEELFDIDKN